MLIHRRVIGGGLTRELVLESDLHCLALLVEVDVRDVVPVEGKVLLAHRIRVQRLIHAVWDPLPLALPALRLWLATLGT